MKRSIICLLIIFTAIPCLLSAQKYGSGFDLLYSKLNEEQLYNQKSNVNHEILSSSHISAGSISLAAFGGLAAYVEVELLLAEPLIDFDPDNELTMLITVAGLIFVILTISAFEIKPLLFIRFKIISLLCLVREIFCNLLASIFLFLYVMY